MTTRCKYYVTSTETTQASRCAGKSEDGSTDRYEICLSVRVTLNAAYSPDPTTENHRFWKSSPSGKMEVVMFAEFAADFIPGSYWYIDTERIDAGGDEQMDAWKLCLLEHPFGSSERLRVNLRKVSAPTGCLDITIDNQEAWGNFKALGDLYILAFHPAKAN